MKTKSSIFHDVNNTPFVVVIEDILENVPEEKWIATVKNNLKEKFTNGITVGSNKIHINKTSRRELTLSKCIQWAMQYDRAAYADKLNWIPNCTGTIPRPEIT